jgi:hypothetical protein
MDLLAYDPLRSDGAHFTVTMVFSAEPNLPREDLEKFHQQWIHALKSQTPGLMVNPSESGHMRIDGENALWMNHSMQTGSGMEKYRDFLVLHGDYRYQFMCAAPAALFETSKEDCLEVINGLHFVKKAHPD